MTGPRKKNVIHICIHGQSKNDGRHGRPPHNRNLVRVIFSRWAWSCRQHPYWCTMQFRPGPLPSAISASDLPEHIPTEMTSMTSWNMKKTLHFVNNKESTQNVRIWLFWVPLNREVLFLLVWWLDLERLVFGESASLVRSDAFNRSAPSLPLPEIGSYVLSNMTFPSCWTSNRSGVEKIQQNFDGQTAIVTLNE